MQDNITLMIDDYIVESTGTLITFENKNIKFNIENMIIELIFKEDETKITKSKNTIINENLMQVELYNFKTLNNFRNKPDEILKLNNKTYYLDLVISNLKERMLINYMLLYKKGC